MNLLYFKQIKEHKKLKHIQDDLSTFVDSLPDPEHRKKLSISIRNIKSISDYLSGYSECV